jgi:hypothetical protein
VPPTEQPLVWPVSKKGDVTMRFVIGVVSSPNVLVSVSVCEGLVLPTVTLPKLSNTGFSSRYPVSLPLLSANARLGAAKPIRKRSAKLTT